MKYSIVFIAVLLFACNRKEAPPVAARNLQTILLKYQLLPAEPQLQQIENSLAGMPIYSKLKKDLNWSNVEMFISNTTNTFVYIVGLNSSKDKKYAFTVSAGKAQQVKDEIFVSSKMIDQANGNIGILKNDEAIVVKFQNGIRTIKNLEEDGIKLFYAREGFCQRQKNQTFKQCYNKEVDEFCDSFVSCVALATNPTVSVLIAVSCTCDAS